MDDNDLCANCHHRRGAHVPRCTDPMLGFGRWCACPAFKEEPSETSDTPAEVAAEVRRPPVRTRKS